MILRRHLGMSVAVLFGGALIGLIAAISPMAAALAVLISVLIVGAMAWPQARSWIATHPRNFRRVGFALMVGGPLVIPLAALASGVYDVAPSWVLGIAMFLSGIGVLLVVLPTSVASAIRDHAHAREIRLAPSEASGWSASHIALDSLAFLARNGLPFLRIFGPWGLINFAILLAAYQLSAAGAADEESVVPLLLMLVLGVGAWVTLLTWPLLVVAWARFVIDRRYPSHLLAMPDRAYLSVLWRGAVLVGVLAVAAELAGTQAPTLAAALGAGDVELVSNLLQALAILAGFLLLSSFALVLPARAMGDRRMSSAISAACLGRFHGGHLLGLVIVLAPFLVLREVVHGVTPEAGAPFVLRAGLSLAMVAVNLGGLAAATTYLARLYQDCRTAAQTCDEVTGLPEPSTA